MENDTQTKTKVIFRKFRKGGSVLALFPEIPGTNELFTCSSYMHVGRHCTAGTGITFYTDPAKPEEYKDLLAELNNIGYNVSIVKKFTQKCTAERLKRIQIKQNKRK